MISLHILKRLLKEGEHRWKVNYKEFCSLQQNPFLHQTGGEDNNFGMLEIVWYTLHGIEAKYGMSDIMDL